ncbi:MAG: MarR family winged helix-turn-helix transcriptional regulator [Planctomycetota bacterium]|jgi:DNA-binding MarR family transcriptional regulator
MPLPKNFKLDADKRTRLGGQLLRLAHRYDRALAERLKHWNLSPSHYEILKLLYAAEDYSLRHKDISQALGVTLPSVTLAIRKLGSMKLVGRQKGEDKRERIVSLTVKGAEYLGELYDSHEGFAEDLFTAISAKSATNLGSSIGKLLTRLTVLEVKGKSKSKA